MGTGSRLLDNFRHEMNKGKNKTSKEEFEVLYRTGFTNLDFLNGMRVHVNGNGIETTYNALGIVDGSSNMIVGDSNTGKSTLMTQIIGYIAGQFENVDVYIDDIEGSLPMSRKTFLLNMSQDEMKSRVEVRNTGITTESFYQRIRFIHDYKLNNRDQYEYDTGLYDIAGNKIIKLYPTLYAMDSFSLLMPDDLLEKEELDKGMGATHVAKMNTQLVKKVSQMLREANIIFFSVNHLNDMPNNGPFPAAPQVAGLPVGKTIPGGKAATYISNNLLYVKPKSTLKATETFGIDGRVIEIKMLKSRTNVTINRSVPLVFNMTEGKFDDILSTFYLLKTEGYVGGAGKSLYLEGYNDIKFSMKEFKQKLFESQELQEAFTKVSYDVLSKYLADNYNKDNIINIFDFGKAIANF